MPRSKAKPRYKPGQWVYLPYRPRPVKALVLEDMGTLGVGGEHVYSVLVPGGEDAEDVQHDAAESRIISAV